MSQSQPISSWRAFRVVTGVALRRRLNKMSAGFRSFGKRKKKAGGAKARQATARKKRGSPIILALFGALFLFNSGLVSVQFLSQLSTEVQRQNLADPAPDGEGAADSIEPENVTGVGGVFSEDLDEWQRKHGGTSTREIKERAYQRIEEMQADKVPAWIRGETIWLDGEQGEALIGAIACLLLFLCVALCFGSLSGTNQELGQVEWSLQWLFTFPVPVRVLFFSKLVEYTLGNMMGWFIFAPFFVVLFWTSGYGAYALILAPCVTIAILGVVGALQLVGETWLRKRLKLQRLKNVQALLTILGLVSLFGVFWIGLSPSGPRFLLQIGDAIGEVVRWLPPCLPASMCAGGMIAWLALAGCLMASALLVCGSLVVTQGLVREGLVTEGATYAGERRSAAEAGLAAGGRGARLGEAASKRWFSGVISKELYLLRRDRSLLVQTLFVPIVIIAFQIVINPGLVKALESNANHAAAIAFGVGAYVLIFSAFRVLVVEGKALWLLFTFPGAIEKMIVQKAVLWGVVASIFPVVVLGWSFCRMETIDGQALINAFMAVAGIWIYAVIAAGIGVLGTDPLEEIVKRRIKPAMTYQFMLMAALYSFAIYTESIWTKVAMLLLCSLLAYAVWQKVRDHIPFLLDPTQNPPPRLSLSDGLFVVFTFFVFQGVAVLICMHSWELGPAPAMVVGFAMAGSAAGLLSLLIFWRRGVLRLFAELGVCSRECDAGLGAQGRALGVGGLWGVLALTVGFGYLLLLENVEPLRRMRDDIPNMSSFPIGDEWWLLALAIPVAPLFEEYIFRGLVYQGLRRTLRPALAVVASAAIFAVVHPPISMVPVFIMGVIAAVAFERTRLLVAPIAVHAVYNAGIVLVQL